MPTALEQALRSPRFPGLFIALLVAIAVLEMMMGVNGQAARSRSVVAPRVELPATRLDPAPVQPSVATKSEEPVSDEPASTAVESVFEPVERIAEPLGTPDQRDTERGPLDAGSGSLVGPAAPVVEPEAVNEAELFFGTARVGTENLNLRAMPATVSEVLAVLPGGMELATGRVLGDWVWVRTPQGETGWVHRGYITGDLAVPVQSESAVSPGDRAAIIESIVSISVAGYRLACPCPYSVDESGRLCGERSAYTRGLGGAPLCYPEDVTDEMIASYRF